MTALALTALLAAADLIGSWNYSGFIYEGKMYPKPNPELNLTFSFDADKTVLLRWERDDQPGFCERLAEYDVFDNQLFQKIIWVNPENLVECQSDPDMQIGKQSITPIELNGDELQLIFDVNGKEFRYLLKRKTKEK